MQIPIQHAGKMEPTLWMGVRNAARPATWLLALALLAWIAVHHALPAVASVLPPPVPPPHHCRLSNVTPCLGHVSEFATNRVTLVELLSELASEVPSLTLTTQPRYPWAEAAPKCSVAAFFNLEHVLVREGGRDTKGAIRSRAVAGRPSPWMRDDVIDEVEAGEDTLPGPLLA